MRQLHLLPFLSEVLCKVSVALAEAKLSTNATYSVQIAFRIINVVGEGRKGRLMTSTQNGIRRVNIIAYRVTK